MLFVIADQRSADLNISDLSRMPPLTEAGKGTGLLLACQWYCRVLESDSELSTVQIDRVPLAPGQYLYVTYILSINRSKSLNLCKKHKQLHERGIW